MIKYHEKNKQLYYLFPVLYDHMLQLYVYLIQCLQKKMSKFILIKKKINIFSLDLWIYHISILLYDRQLLIKMQHLNLKHLQEFVYLTNKFLEQML